MSLLGCGPAAAQDTRTFNIAAGYSSLRDVDINETLPGWVLSGTRQVGSMFGITAEIGGDSKSLQVLGTTLTYRDLSFAAGPRLAWRRFERITPFGQILAGGVRRTTGILDQSSSNIDVAIQPGAGVDVWMGERFGIRGSVDHRRMKAADVTVAQWRFQLGMVIGGGAE